MHTYPIGGRIFQNLCIQPAPFHRINQSGDVGFAGLRFSAAGGRGSMFAPVIENVWNVNDFSRLLGGAQHEIIVLREIELLAETAECKGELASVGAQMSDIHKR